MQINEVGRKLYIALWYWKVTMGYKIVIKIEFWNRIPEMCCITVYVYLTVFNCIFQKNGDVKIDTMCFLQQLCMLFVIQILLIMLQVECILQGMFETIIFWITLIWILEYLHRDILRIGPKQNIKFICFSYA